MIGEATTDDLAGTPVIKSRHGWRPVGVSRRESAETIKCAALMGPLLELFAIDKRFLSHLYGDRMSVVSHDMKLPICDLGTLMKRVTRISIEDGCVFDFNR